MNELIIEIKQVRSAMRKLSDKLKKLVEIAANLSESEEEHSIYTVHREIETLGFSCSKVKIPPFSSHLAFIVETTEGNIRISSTATQGRLAILKISCGVIYVDYHQVVHYFQERLDLIKKDYSLPYGTKNYVRESFLNYKS